MPILNYTTDVSVEKTMAAIVAMLARKGVLRTAAVYDSEGVPSGVEFSMSTEYGPRSFRLPVRTEGVLLAMEQDSRVPKSKRTPEQAARVAWRIAKDWLEAQLALVDAGLARLDEAMFPYMLDGSGTTAFEGYSRSQITTGHGDG